MLVRKCDLETAQALSRADKEKLLAIIELDSLQTDKGIMAAAVFISSIARREQKKRGDAMTNEPPERA